MSAGSDTRRPTIRDVARHAGVSKSLVSLVFRDATSVSDKRREAVLRAAEDLGYRPNLIARGLSAATTGLIGVLAADLTNPFFSEVIDGAQAALRDDQTLLLGTGRKQTAAEEARIIDRFLQQTVDGLLLLAPRATAQLLRDTARSVPTVIVGHDGRVPGADVINADEDTGCRLAIEHLRELGHRRITFLDARAATPRLRAYKLAMQAAGLGHHIDVAPAQDTMQGGQQATEVLLERAVRPTAVLAFNDYAALGALAAVEEAGLRVPQDLSVIGYDDITIAAMPRVSLTTVHLPRAEVGEMAVGQLNARIADQDKRGTLHEVTPHLVIRRSSGPAPQLESPEPP